MKLYLVYSEYDQAVFLIHTDKNLACEAAFNYYNDTDYAAWVTEIDLENGYHVCVDHYDDKNVCYLTNGID